MSRKIVAEALTREAFAPFGDVICTDGADHFPINDGATERYNALAPVEIAGADAGAIVSIFRSQPFTPPVTLQLMERHPLGSQAFMPLAARPYLVVVAPDADGGFDSEGMRAFLAHGNQGVNYRTGVWHHPLLALDAVSDFLVVDRAGPGENCEKRTLGETVRVCLPRG